MRIFKVILFVLISFVLVAPFFHASADNSTETNQYYSVIFDKEQEAAVVAKLTYYNRTKDEMKDLALEIPGTTVRIISAVQEKTTIQSSCSRYDYNYPATSNQERPCLEWREVPGTSSYTLLDFDSSRLIFQGQSTIFNVSLKEAIASQKSGTIILYYKTKGLVSSTWNGYQYNFQTIKSNFDIDKVRVAINVTDDLYIKSTAKGETNYQTNDIPQAAETLSGASFKASSSLDRVSQVIQTSPGVVKETSSLDPNENFRVEGKYYSSSWMGELPTIIGVGITFLIIVIVLLLIIKSEKKKI